jgi:hypothetical protein
MPEQPLQLHQVLSQEYKALRPGVDFSGENPSEVFDKLRRQPQPLSALCISGGGIRSATFSLGALQGLARHGILNKFDYLSTVSGGGYIGSWLSAWIKRAGGLENVAPTLGRDTKRALGADVDPVGHLREYNNYLSPRLGFFSADTWTLAATVLRNILLNWLVLVPLLMFALMVPRLLLAVIMLGKTYKELHGSATAIATSWFVVHGLPVLSGVLLAMAIFNVGRYLPNAGGRDHSQGDFLLKILAPLVGAVLAFVAYDCLYFWGPNWVAETGLLQVILWILLPSAAGWILFLLFCVKSFRQKLKFLFGPLSFAIILMAGSTGAAAWVITNKLLPSTTWEQYLAIGPPLLLLALDLGTAVFVGLSSNALKDEDREWLARASAWNQLFSFSWLAACVVVLLIPEFTFHWKIWGKELFAAVGAASAWFSRQSTAAPPSGQQVPGVAQKILGFVKKLAPAIFILTFCVGLSILTNWLLYETGFLFPAIEKGKEMSWVEKWWDHHYVLEHTPWALALTGLGTLAVFGWIMARYININRFSLHAMYRSRLIRAYLGASNPQRNASHFTGFSSSDNLLMSDLRTGFKPFHVLNLALNLVSGERLAWQQRKAQSFTVSPLHSGNYELGYRDSAQYGGADGITLGTAVTISGAAASPSMGYHTSAVIGFVMTLLNARLGSWLGNPGVAGEKTWRHAGPRSAVGSLVKEALGLANNKSGYVYLSDGGHFENLALYEMILRRCRHIVVLDSGCDPDFTYEDLGNALRKIRIDLKIPIDFDDQYIEPLHEKKKRCAVATIRYSSVDKSWADGQLIYIKPMLLGTEPPDVEAYAAANPTFPHQTTANQWFNESQTESYRMLGVHTVDEICRDWSGGSLDELLHHVEDVYLTARPVEVEKSRRVTATAASSA